MCALGARLVSGDRQILSAPPFWQHKDGSDSPVMVYITVSVFRRLDVSRGTVCPFR